MTSIEHARRDVHAAFAEVLCCADSAEGKSLYAFERRAWTLLLALGRALVRLFLARQVSRPRPVEYKHRGVRYKLLDERTSPLGTLFGKVMFTRPIGRRPRALKKVADLPVDREIGLVSGFSLGVTLGIARLGAQMPFAAAREMWRSIFEWSPSSKAALRMIDAVGDEARPFLEQAEAPDDDGEILVVQVDGGGAPMISDVEHARRCRPNRSSQKGTKRRRRRERRRDHPRPRRTKGKKSKNAKEAFLGVIYTLRKTDDGMEGPINKQVIGTFESHRALFIWLRAEADKRGYGRKHTLFLADGSDHIWRLQQEYFPDAECCLDWYHLVEYLWKAGRCFHREGSKALRKWVAEQKKRLRTGRVDEVLAELRSRLEATAKTGPGNKGRRERLTQVIGYITEHKGRMPYASFLERDLDIGSGAVEGAVRNVVRMRLDGPGMRWGRQRSERVLHLRCILLNRRWDEFADYLSRRPDLALAAQPERARTHNAKAAA